MIKDFFSLIFIALVLFKQNGSIILTEKTDSKNERLLTAKDAIKSQIETIRNGKQAIDIDTEGCNPYDPQDPKKRFQICIKSVTEDGKSLTIEFRNPISHTELSYFNMDPKSQASDIQMKTYIEQFDQELEELIFDESARKDLIEAAIVKGANAAGATDVKVGNNKLVYTYKEKVNTISYLIEGNILNLDAKFFQDSIDLSIPKKKFITFETEKLVQVVIVHLHLMQQFVLSDGETAAKSIKTITCQSIVGNGELLSELQNQLVKDKMKASIESDMFVIKGGEKKVDVTCDEISVGDFQLVHLKADFAGVSEQILPVTQTFLSRSLYNLMPVVQSFFIDLGIFVTRILSDSNPSEDFEAS